MVMDQVCLEKDVETCRLFRRDSVEECKNGIPIRTEYWTKYHTKYCIVSHGMVGSCEVFGRINCF